jgi:catechol 2,3-dioxygenase-like lactoylglutathione lyase family enzyme
MIDHIYLPVSDLNRSGEFYKKVLEPLGIDMPYEFDRPPIRSVTFPEEIVTAGYRGVHSVTPNWCAKWCASRTAWRVSRVTAARVPQVARPASAPAVRPN